MAHSGPDSGGSQFFVTFLPTPQLDGLHTAFGRVVEGLDILAEINKRNPDPPAPNKPPPDPKTLPKPDKIVEAKVLRRRPGTDYSQFTRTPEK